MRRDRNFRDELIRALHIAAHGGDVVAAFRVLAAYEGERVYLARGHSRSGKGEIYGTSLSSGTGIGSTAASLGDCRATAYRIAGLKTRAR